MANKVLIDFENSPSLQIQYHFKVPFLQLVPAFFKKYNWEEKTTLTTISNVQQVNPNTIVFYRRVDLAVSPVYSYEKVTINREN